MSSLTPQMFVLSGIAFRFDSWDGVRWRVTVETKWYRGWHGFDLESTPGGCRVTHTLDVALSGAACWTWPTCFASIHDWAVEAIFDRIDEALRTGDMPQVTRRPMPLPASLVFPALRHVARRRRPP